MSSKPPLLVQPNRRGSLDADCEAEPTTDGHGRPAIQNKRSKSVVCSPISCGGAPSIPHAKDICIVNKWGSSDPHLSLISSPETKSVTINDRAAELYLCDNYSKLKEGTKITDSSLLAQQVNEEEITKNGRIKSEAVHPPLTNGTTERHLTPVINVVTSVSDDGQTIANENAKRKDRTRGSASILGTSLRRFIVNAFRRNRNDYPSPSSNQHPSVYANNEDSQPPKRGFVSTSSPTSQSKRFKVRVSTGPEMNTNGKVETADDKSSANHEQSPETSTALGDRNASKAHSSHQDPTDVIARISDLRHSPQPDQTSLTVRRSRILVSSNAERVNSGVKGSSMKGTQRRKSSGSINLTDKRENTSNSGSRGWLNAVSTAYTAKAESVVTIDEEPHIECPLCVLVVREAQTPALSNCNHRVCIDCMQRYVTTEINHSRLNITCPVCSEVLHPNEIKYILQNEKLYSKYESFMLRRVLAAEPDARWCPAPDCGFAVLATGCASCPRIVCGREGCGTSFCYHCKQEWHPNQTCSAASIQRNRQMFNTIYNIADLIEEPSANIDDENPLSNARAGRYSNPKTSTSHRSSKTANGNATSTIRVEDIKECPVCGSRIIKMNDGSCNHMTCSICETQFCWLCMKEISDMHYFSPSGCTFWGKKPWSRKKKLLWQLGMLVGAPICIILIAGIAVPAIVIGVPVWAARKLHSRLERKPLSPYRKNAIITGGVLLSFIISPFISAIALAIGIPILLGYVYGVVPLSLCRSSGGCLSSAPSLEAIPNEYQATRVNINGGGVPGAHHHLNDVGSIDTAMSHKLGDPSIGETSLYMSNISLETNSIGHVTTVERDDRESASNAALAGSVLSQAANDGNSTRALAGSIISKESGYTLVPAEVHSSAVNSVNTKQSNCDSTKTSPPLDPIPSSADGGDKAATFSSESGENTAAAAAVASVD